MNTKKGRLKTSFRRPFYMLKTLSDRSFNECSQLAFSQCADFSGNVLPFLNTIRVGMPRTPNLAGVTSFSSILILTTFRRPWNSEAMSSKIGAIILQGPHHGAQKSSNTGTSDFKTSCSKLASLAWIINRCSCLFPFKSGLINTLFRIVADRENFKCRRPIIVFLKCVYRNP